MELELLITELDQTTIQLDKINFLATKIMSKASEKAKHAKNALEYINQLYNEKIIDNDFLLRTSTNICELIENGLCGSFF